MSIDPAAAIGPVSLRVSDLNRSAAFYETNLGLRVRWLDARTAVVGTEERDLVVLSATDGPPLKRGTTGLYHFALLVPTRAELASALRRLVRHETRMQGFADHGVSEALYLPDPDGNGIEIYRDRPRDDWPVVGRELRMTIDPLDVDGLLGEPEPPGNDDRMASGTVMGHVHLHVADLTAARAFYVGVLGFDVMQRFGPSALFVSAGGYHHHIGLNTWAGIGAPAPPAHAVGLRDFTVIFPRRQARDEVIDRILAAGLATEQRDDDVFVRDPSQNVLRLTVAN